MIGAFIGWTAVALLFAVIGHRVGKSEKPAGFFTGVPAVKMKDVKGYNRDVARIWVRFAVCMEILGIPLIFIEQNSIVGIFLIFGVVILVFWLILSYFKVEAKYRE